MPETRPSPGNLNLKLWLWVQVCRWHPSERLSGPGRAPEGLSSLLTLRAHMNDIKVEVAVPHVQLAGRPRVAVCLVVS